jgi:hypothetical protein
MAPSRIKTSDDAKLEKTDEALALALLHLRTLLRVKNRLRSPFLRLPAETIIRILSFTNLGRHHHWQSIFSTCHRINEIMREATDVWWKVTYNCTLCSLRAADLALMRSKGTPQMLVADLGSWSSWRYPDAASFLGHWKDERVFQGSKLHTLEFYGIPSAFTHFSWILEGPLPRLEHLKIRVLPQLDDLDSVIPLRKPVALQLPTDMPLRVLDLDNASPSCPPYYFTGLRELHLRFQYCRNNVIMPEDSLLEILDASPELERLSLGQVTVGNNQRLPPKRIVLLPKLTSLWLSNDPEAVGYILAHMDIPAIASLDIHARSSSGDVTQTFSHSFPNDRLPKRLFSDPPTFGIGATDNGEEWPSIGLNIGSFGIRFESRFFSASRNAVMACIPLVPSSVTALQGDLSMLDKQEWRDFFRSHPEVRSIECFEFKGSSLKALWDALSPVQGDDRDVSCPSLESIRLTVLCEEVQLGPLLSCLRDRKGAGFKLKHLNIDDDGRRKVYKMAEEFRPLVEVLEVKFPSIETQRVSHVSTHGADVC